MNRFYSMSEKEEALQKRENVIDQIYEAAKSGYKMTLEELISNLSKEEQRSVLEKVIEDDVGQRCSAFVIAAKNGHDNVVKTLLKYTVNLEQEGFVEVHFSFVEGASALWCAAAGGHLNVIKTLVRAGADINHATLTKSTPLRAACFDGRLDIVTYLVEHNANMHILNKYNNSCLMIAAYRGHVDVVNYLLQKGADANQKALCGATAMHFAAECGHVDIVKILLKYGAKITKNEHGLTPLLAGAERTRIQVVEFFIELDEVALEEKIEALELLGASFGNDKDFYSLELAYKYMKQAMHLRYSDPNNVIKKLYYKPIVAYGSKEECQNITDLDILRYSADEFHMECLAIRERILGQRNPDVLHSVVYRGAVFADQSKFNPCITLWLHALYLAQLNSLTITKDLTRFAQVFSQMIIQNEPLPFTYVEEVLSVVISDLQKYNFKDLNEEIEKNLLTALYLVVIMGKIRIKLEKSEKDRVHQLVHKLVALNVITSQGQTLLHLAVDSDTPVDKFHIVDVCRFPCPDTTKLLIKCGSDINAMDKFRNTPLHIIAAVENPMTNDAVRDIVITLVKSGAHIDIVNMIGKTPFEIANIGETKTVFNTLLKTSISLQCLSARVINKFCVPYVNLVPKNLEKFINLHGVLSQPIP